MEPDQKPAAPDGSPADAQGADYNNDEGTRNRCTDGCFRSQVLAAAA